MAGKSTISITFKLDGDGKGFKQLASDANGFKEAVSAAVVEASKLNSRAINFAALSSAIDQAQQALQSLQSGLKDLADAYAVQESAERQLETAMRNTMGASAAQIQSIKDLCSAQQELGVIGDEVQLQGAQELATYLAKTDTLKQLIPVMNDMVAQQYGLAASGENAAQIATMLGKVMNGQVNALSRYGYTFGDAQAQILKFGDESQRAAVLAEVVGQSVGGMNEALAKTDSGKQKQLENTLGDIKERLGKLTNAALPFVTIAANTAIALMGLVKLISGIKTATAVASTWNIKGTLAAGVCKLVGINSARSAALVRVFSSALRGGAYSAIAFKVALRGLLIATGIGAAIVAITSIIEYFAGASERAKNATDELIDAEKRAERETERLNELKNTERSTLENTRAQLEINIATLREFNGTKRQEKKLVDEMNNTYGETMGYFQSVSDWYKALTANSEDYCRQMVLEARTRTLANQIAAKEQENYEIQSKLAEGKYSDKREKRSLGGHMEAGRMVYSYEEIVGTSEVDQANAAIEENIADIKKLHTELDTLIQEAAGISLKITGTDSPPGIDNSAKWKEDAKNLKEIGDNIKILQDRLQTASLEEAAEINQQIEQWQAKAKAIREAGKAVEDNSAKWNDQASTLKEIGDNIKILQDRLQTASLEEAAEINRQITLWQDKAKAIREAGKAVEGNTDTWNDQASTLKDITTNIRILNERLETASIDEAASINQSIALWEKKADAIRRAGEAGKSTFETFKDGWGTVRGLGNSIQSVTDALNGNGNAWQKTAALVDAFISLYDGIQSVVKIIDTLSAVTTVQAAATTTEAAAATAAATAEGAETASAVAHAAAEAPAIAANKLAAASYLELAAAAYMAAHASIPFAGFGIAAGYTASAAALVKSMGLMTFAKGGIAYGPTLGLFGEYAGASNNPEVVAPLDKLRSMLEPRGTWDGKVEFEIRGDRLAGVLQNRKRQVSRAQ